MESERRHTVGPGLTLIALSALYCLPGAAFSAIFLGEGRFPLHPLTRWSVSWMATQILLNLAFSALRVLQWRRDRRRRMGSEGTPHEGLLSFLSLVAAWLFAREVLWSSMRGPASSWSIWLGFDPVSVGIKVVAAMASLDLPRALARLSSRVAAALRPVGVAEVRPVRVQLWIVLCPPYVVAVGGCWVALTTWRACLGGRARFLVFLPALVVLVHQVIRGEIPWLALVVTALAARALFRYREMEAAPGSLEPAQTDSDVSMPERRPPLVEVLGGPSESAAGVGPSEDDLEGELARFAARFAAERRAVRPSSSSVPSWIPSAPDPKATRFALETLEAGLASPNADVQCRSVRALAAIGAKGHERAVLALFMNSDNRSVRIACLEALKMIGGEVSVGVLSQRPREQDLAIRFYVQSTLACLASGGVQSPPVEPLAPKPLVSVIG